MREQMPMYTMMLVCPSARTTTSTMKTTRATTVIVYTTKAENRPHHRGRKAARKGAPATKGFKE